MKISRLTKIILIASAVALVVALLFPMVARMPGVYTDDSGFDGGYDSGGWDSGSDWDSGSSWDSDSGGGSYSGSGSSIEFFVFIYVFL